jgi:hypothetical protein
VSKSFNIVDYWDQLTPDGGTNSPRGDHSFLCPACGASNFKVHITTGKWAGWNCDCSKSEAGKRRIRNILSPAINPSDKPAGQKPHRKKQTRAWQYTDASGTPILLVHRADNGNGKRKMWQESLVEDKKAHELTHIVTPYGLAEALQALAEGAPHVFWVEGEPCVDALRELGLPAVTSIGGAGKFNPGRDGGLLPPDRLVVVPDRDQPGIKHAEAVSAAHPGCQWLYPFPDSPEWNGSCPAVKGLDVADWIAHGATVEQLLAGIGPKQAIPKAQLSGKAKVSCSVDGNDELSRAQRIDIRVQELLEAQVANDASALDAAFSELYRLGINRERGQERALMLWAEQNGLDISTGSKPQTTVRGRVVGQAKAGAGLRQQIPGFGLDKDLHLVVSDAAGGKTTSLCELVTVFTARDKGFLDHQAPRTDPLDDPRKTALVIASDGEGSAYSMWEDYLDSVSAIERGAVVEVWAQNDDTGEAAWNVSLHNLERLVNRLDEGDVAVVVMDTANSIFRGAGINTGVGPIETYLRLLKQIVCRHCSLWISHHTNRVGGTTMKAIGGHPAFQEVPSVVHLIEMRDQADGGKLRVWHVLKLRGAGYRRFSYELNNGELKVTEGHFYENCREQLLVLLHNQLLIDGITSPAELIKLSRRPKQSVYQALYELRGLKLVRAHGHGHRLTNAGEQAVQALQVAARSNEPAGNKCKLAPP